MTTDWLFSAPPPPLSSRRGGLGDAVAVVVVVVVVVAEDVDGVAVPATFRAVVVLVWAAANLGVTIASFGAGDVVAGEVAAAAAAGGACVSAL